MSDELRDQKPLDFSRVKNILNWTGLSVTLRAIELTGEYPGAEGLMKKLWDQINILLRDSKTPYWVVFTIGAGLMDASLADVAVMVKPEGGKMEDVPRKYTHWQKPELN